MQGRSPVLLVDHAQVGSHRRFGIFRSTWIGNFPGGTFVLSNLITDWHLATMPPPPSVPHAGILASLSGQAVSRVPQFQFEKCSSNP